MRTWLALVVIFGLTGCASIAPSASRDSKGPTATVMAPAIESPVTAGAVVVTIGDSIMRGLGVATDEAWPALLGAETGWSVQNLGCDSAGVLAVGNPNECDSDYSGLVDEAIALHPDVVIFQGSSNDLGESNDDLLAETTSDLAELHAALPHTLIIGLSAVWNDQAEVPSQLGDIDDQVNSAVSAVGGLYIDIGEPIEGHPDWMLDDDVHPTADGHVALAAAIQSAFANAGVIAR